PPKRALPINLPLDILFEDPYLMVVNKPAGIAVHAGSGVPTGLIEHLRETRPEIRFLELVHRLDRETSGCLVLSKRRSVLRALHENLRQNSEEEHRFTKRYQALVHGNWQVKNLVVEIPLRKNVERSGERMVLPVKDGLYAKSEFTSLQNFDNSTLVGIRLITGRTHQARVHAATSGHPIIGDEKYGIKQVNSFYRSIGLRRLFLHADYIRFIHPVTSTTIELNCPLPLELSQVIQKLSTAGIEA
ncbi:MAG: RluA family pseudouridine synthase, partial [Arenicellales bacterium]|nr:RluA family pseudouridine synthase [Arenicellales bacterium]